MKKILILLTFLLATCFVIGQSKTGSTAAPFLNIAVGPRAIAMGGAFVATADDITALYWNPAGVSRMGTSGATFNHTQWFADINYNYAGAVVNLGEMGAVGMQIQYLDYGDIEVTNLVEQEGTGEMYNPSDMAIGLTYAYNLTDRFSMGGTVKYVQQTIWNSSASTVAFDIGVLFHSEIYGLRIGSSITNFGSDMQIDGKALYVQHDVDPNSNGNNNQILAKLNTDEFPIPLTFRVGLAMDVFNDDMNKLTVAVDALHPNDNDESLNAGAEYVFMNILALRGGYKSIFLDNSVESYTLGAGLKYEFAPNLVVSFDYAYQDMDVLEEVQHFAVSINF